MEITHVESAMFDRINKAPDNTIWWVDTKGCDTKTLNRLEKKGIVKRVGRNLHLHWVLITPLI